MAGKIIRTATILLAFILISTPSLFAHPSWGIVVSSAGIVYFSDLETVWKIDRDGNVSVFRPGVSGHHVHELSIDGEGNIYGPITVYDVTTQKYLLGVWKMTPDGKEAELQPPVDSVMSGISIWRDKAGNMYSIEQNNNLKEKTLLLRRTPNGIVSTVAGGEYGHADGKGTAAKLGSVTAMIIAPDGNIYLTDGTGVRRVTLDGDVKTLAQDVTTRTTEDGPTLFGGNDKNIFGLAINADRNAYVADAGNRRLVKIASDGKFSVVYRLDPPYFPTGVFATANGDLYVLEFSYTPPGTTDKPRVRKIAGDGKITIFTTSAPTRTGVTIAPSSQVRKSRFQSLFDSVNPRGLYLVILLVGGLTIVTILFWRRSRKQRT